MVTSTKAVLISTGHQYTKQYCMSIQIRYRSCNVLVPNSGSRYQRYQMLVSVMKTVPFLYRHVYWVRCSGCSSMGEKLWNRTILRDYYESSMSRTIRWGSAFSSMTSQWIITCHGNENLKVLTHWLPRYVAAILNLLISDTILWLMSLVFPKKFSSGKCNGF